MARIETSVVIKRPQQDVFEYLTDLRNAKEWSPEVVDVSYDGELSEGSRGADTRRMGRKEIVMPWRVTSFEPPSQIVLDYERPFPITARFSFTASASGTRVTCETDLHPKGWWRLLMPMMVREARKADEIQFQKVKTILEARRKGVGEQERSLA
jgi:uncharacterized protein YndB with AHSA1/START domain